MFVKQIFVNTCLFLIGTFGILSNRRNILVVLMCIEIMLLSVNLNFMIFSSYLDNFLGQIFSLFILTVAAAESAIGLAILILYFRAMGHINITSVALLKG